MELHDRVCTQAAVAHHYPPHALRNERGRIHPVPLATDIENTQETLERRFVYFSVLHWEIRRLVKKTSRT